MPEIYRSDVAYIHDSGFGHFALAAAPVPLDALKRGRFERGLVVDLGCGSGILSKDVSDAGNEVLGIAISDAMIALAQRRAPHGQFRTESLLLQRKKFHMRPPARSSAFLRYSPASSCNGSTVAILSSRASCNAPSSHFA